MEERCRILREVGRVMVDEFGGEFSNLVKKAGNSAVKVIMGEIIRPGRGWGGQI